MSSPASLRPPVACSTLAVLVALAGCGNRGELYLEPSPDGVIDAIEGLGADLPTRDARPGSAPDPSPLVPDGGIAPTVAPDVGSDGAPGVVPDVDKDKQADEDDEADDVGRGGERAVGDNP